MSTERNPSELIWDVLRGAMTTKALGVAADLGIAKALADGPRPVEDLARTTGADADALHRLLRALASDGVFAEEAPGVFRQTDASEPLRGPDTAAFAHLFGDVFYRAVADLDRAVRTGRTTFPEAFGTDFWSWLAEHDEERAAFDRAMAGGKDAKAERIADLVEWRSGETVVDVGGGNGSLLVELVRRRTGVRGVVFDLPETVRDESPLGPGVEFVAGSFFEHVPAGDTYLLSGILHDWNDERASAILQTILASARTGARVLILESVLPPGNAPDGAKWLDLLMLVLLDGRERTESQWRTLLEDAGLVPVRIEDGLIEVRCH